MLGDRVATGLNLDSLNTDLVSYLKGFEYEKTHYDGLKYKVTVSVENIGGFVFVFLNVSTLGVVDTGFVNDTLLELDDVVLEKFNQLDTDKYYLVDMYLHGLIDIFIDYSTKYYMFSKNFNKEI